jgi:hypothetical protein
VSDLNLIPESWNQARTVKRSLLGFGAAYGVVAVAIAVGSVFLANRIDVESRELDRLRGDKNSALAQRARLDVLKTRQGALAREVRTLKRLGGTPDVRRVFSTVERSLDADVWFREWVFRRAGEFVEVGPQTVDTGFLIVVPAGTSGEASRGWRVKTHMEIRGEALSHSALAAFVRRLSRSPEVAEVKILDSRSVMSGGVRVVGFELAVVVRERGTEA